MRMNVVVVIVVVILIAMFLIDGYSLMYLVAWFHCPLTGTKEEEDAPTSL